MIERPIRVAHLVSHPIPYFAPLYRELATRPEIDLTVYFYSDATVRDFHDAEFGRSVRWDTQLLDGYRSRILPSAKHTPAVSSDTRVSLDVVRDVAAQRYDVVWAHGYAHATTWVALAAARMHGARLLLRDEQTLLHDRPRVRSIAKAGALRALFSQAGGLYIGEENRQHMRAHGAREDALFPARYCVDNAYFGRHAAELAPQRAQLRRRFGITGDAPVVLFVGKLIDKKQPLRLIEAFARVRAQHECALLIAGDGPLRAECETLIARLGVPDVRMAGFLNQSELPEAYAAADLFVLPSRLHETWGLVVNEAMNFGLPIVVSDKVGCAADLVRAGGNGYVVGHEDTAALADALAALVAAPAMRAAFGRRSVAIVEDYSIEACADGIVAACTGQRAMNQQALEKTWQHTANAA